MQRQTTIAHADKIERKWFVVDASGKTLGRLDSEVARVLTGKKKAIYTPNFDCGDYVIIINASKVAYSGDQEQKKNYYNASGYGRGIRTRSIGVMVREYPVELVERAVWGMLPKGRLGRQIYKKLFVYEGNEHKHEAQQPIALEIKY